MSARPISYSDLSDYIRDNGKLEYHREVDPGVMEFKYRPKEVAGVRASFAIKVNKYLTGEDQQHILKLIQDVHDWVESMSAVNISPALPAAL